MIFPRPQNTSNGPAQLLVLLLVIVINIGLLARMSDAFVAGEQSTIELLLPASERREIHQLHGMFNRGDEYAMAQFSDIDERTQLKLDTYVIPGLKALPEIDSVAQIDALIFIQFGKQRFDFEQSRRINQHIKGAFSSVSGNGKLLSLLGSTFLRVAAWETNQSEFQRTLLPLLILVTLIPMLIFKHWSAALPPLLLTTTTALLTLSAMQLTTGSLNTVSLYILPFIFAIATLDALHLIRAVQRAGHSALRKRVLVHALRAPCAVTSITTIAGLLVLAAFSDLPLLREFGLWSAFATLLAFFLTFSVGTVLLQKTIQHAGAGRTKIALIAVGVAELSMRYTKTVFVFWLVCALLSCWAIFNLQVSAYYPTVFSAQHTYQQQLDHFIARTHIDPAPIDIYIRADNDAPPDGLLIALSQTMHYVGRFDETQYVFPRDLLLRVIEGEAIIGSSGQRTDWIRPEQDIARAQLFLRPTTHARKQELITWIRHFDRTFLDEYSLTLTGTGYLYNHLESQALTVAAQSAVVTLLTVFAVFCVVLRSATCATIATTGAAVPLLVVGGLLWLGRIDWSMLLLPAPAVMIGLAVDDAIYLLWGLSRGKSHTRRILIRNAKNAGPALLGTSVLLCCAFATALQSDILANRDFAYLLTSSLLLALLCNLTLAPALLTIFRHKSILPYR